MEEQEKQTSTQSHAEHHEEHHPEHVEHKSTSLKSKIPWVIIAILLFLLGIFGGYFVLSQNNKSQIQPVVPSPGPNAYEGTSTPVPSPTSAKLKSFTSAKFDILSFKGYSLMYPEDWILSEQRDEGASISTVTLTKDGYTLKIYQAATGGAGCIYEGAMPEGPASDYRNNKYKDLESFATLRQTETPSGGKMAYNYCQKNTGDGSFGQPTSVGHMSASTPVANPDPAIIGELEKIVESIKTL